ncbi:Protein dispatched [Strongyloides ratti]|uniref:glutathione transferase n=1 Tax=Strongyloides ratti TaxID=34506 RepID=A0A090LD32_STRRB|nr:Protein dispatched [Strongyloides ratti]CEF67662.1 Protein dispatched [Strongyloides ratti]
MIICRSVYWDIFPYSKFIFKFPLIIILLTIIFFTVIPLIILFIKPIHLTNNPEKGFDTRDTYYSGPRLAWDQIQGILSLGNRVPFQYDNINEQNLIEASFKKNNDIKLQNSRLKRNWADNLVASLTNVACYENPIPAMDYLSQFVIEIPSIDKIFDPDFLTDMCLLQDELMDEIMYFGGMTPYKSIFHIANFFSCFSPNYRVNCTFMNYDDIQYSKSLMETCLPYRDQIISCRKHCHKLGNPLTIETCLSCENDEIPKNCSSQMVFDLFYRILPKYIPGRPIYLNNYLPFFSYTAYKLQGMDVNIKKYVELEKKLKEIFKKSKFIQLKGLNFEVKRDLLLPYAIRDSKLAIIAAIIVFIIIGLYSFSITYTLAILYMLSTSVLSALAVYTFFTQDFPLLNLVVFVLLIAIGSDDAFLVYSSFKSGENFDVYTFHESLKHIATTMFLTQFSTVVPFFVNILSKVIVFRSFGLFAGFTLTFNYFLLISFLPAFVALEKKLSKQICPRLKPPTIKWMNKLINHSINEILPAVVIQGRFVWIVSLTIYSGISIFIIINQLHLPQYNPLQLFARNNLHEWFDNNAEIQFEFVETKLALPLNMRLVWGLNKVQSLSHFNADKVTNVTVDKRFRIRTLTELKNLAKELYRMRNLPFVQHPTKFWPERFLDWSKTLPCTPDAACCNVTNKYFEDDFLDYCMRISTTQIPTMFNDTPIYHNVTFEFVGYTALLPTQLKYNHRFKLLSEAFDKFDNEFIPMMSSNNFWYSPEWSLMSIWIDLQKAIVSDCQYSTYISIFVVAIFAFICLKLKSIVALICITFIVISSGGTVVFFGWELGVLEAVILVLVVGLSFDYTLHYGAAIPKSGCVYHRIEQALKTAAVPVALAASTSFLAGFVMLFSITHAFFQVGMFLVVSILASYIFSTFFFLPLLYMTLKENDDCNYCKKEQKFPGDSRFTTMVYKLTYFGVRGYGEPARLMFRHAGVDFDDNVIDHSVWPKIKPTTPFGQVPVLEVEGKQIAQSFAIYRFLGNKFGLCPGNEVDKAMADSIAEYVKEFDNKAHDYFIIILGFMQGDKDAEWKNKVLPAVEQYFPVITNWLKAAGNGYLTKAGLSWVDFFAAEKLGNVVNTCQTVAAKYPEIKAFVDKIYSLPTIKSYVESRSKVPY